MLYLIANWKSHKKLSEVRAWFDLLDISAVATTNLTQVVCPPTPFLLDVADMIHKNKLPLHLGIQDISPYPFGAYTGETAAPMVSDWVKYAIIGHSERRRYFSETNDQVTQKAMEALEANITPIVCIDEPYLASQLKSIPKQLQSKIIVAYEPITAIGSGSADSPKHADLIGSQIKKLTDNRTPVLYGGSVTADNIGLYINQTHINGALIGGASLDPQSWSQLVLATTPSS